MPKFIPLTMLKDTTGIVEFCQDCGEHISEARLEARPHAVYCIKCKSEREKNNRF